MGEKGENENITSAKNDSFFSMEVDAPSMIDCFVNHPAVIEMEALGNAKFHTYTTTCPLPHSNLRDKQLQDEELMRKANHNPALFKWIPFGDIELLCICPPNTQVYRICIPTNVLTDIVQWYHETLSLIHI